MALAWNTGAAYSALLGIIVNLNRFVKELWGVLATYVGEAGTPNLDSDEHP